MTIPSNKLLAPVEVLASTTVVLADGASITLRVRAVFNTTAPSESIIQDTISNWFQSDGLGKTTTLYTFKNDTKYLISLLNSLKGITNFQHAQLISLLLHSPPLQWFEEQAKDVFAILKSGESIRIRIASPSNSARPPNSLELGRLFSLLSRLTLTELSNPAEALKEVLRENNDRVWPLSIIGMEILNCGCQH